MKFIFRISIILISVMATCGMQSCFTGVEGTKKIELTKKELSLSAPTEEEKLLGDISFPSLKEWQKGRKFKVTDEKINVVMESGAGQLKPADVISYTGMQERVSPDGYKKLTLVFDKDGNEYRMPLDKSPEEALSSYTSANLPLMIDMEVVDGVRSRLVGKRFWTRNAMWYDQDLKYKKGRKFIPVDITAVETGDAFFPVKIEFKDSTGDLSYLLINVGSSGNDTRSFAKLFLLQDPRKQRKSISDENWVAIQNGEIRIGMTKEECRLALGNPSDTNIGHDYSRSLEIWYYPDGKFVQFADDLVVNFRK